MHSSEQDRLPRAARVARGFGLERGAGELVAGEPVLLLGRVEEEVLCFAGGRRLFKVPAAEVGERFRPAADEEDLPVEGEGLLLALLVVGGAGLRAAEAEVPGGIESFGDALWYGINTISTVGVGDVAPETPLGKLIASGMMFLGNPLYAKVGERLVDRLLAGGRAGADAVSHDWARLIEAIGS